MELLTVLVGVVGPVVTHMLKNVWDDYRKQGETNTGIAVNQNGYQTHIPNIGGALSVPATYNPYIYQPPPIRITGKFLASEDFADLMDIMLLDEEKMVILLVVSEFDEEVYFFDFDFDGYAINILPGVYSFFVFIVDPILDDVLGFGYPLSDNPYNPNPIEVSGMVYAELDFYISDIDELGL